MVITLLFFKKSKMMENTKTIFWRQSSSLIITADPNYQESYRICSIASHVRVLGGAPGASICLRIFWNRMAFFCRLRVLGERTNGRSHACKQDGWLKRLGLITGVPSPLFFVRRLRNRTPRTAPKLAQLFLKRVMKYVTSEGTHGSKDTEHLPLRL